MSTDLFKILIVCVYAVLVYKFYKNTVLLLLFTLATILALCNINKIKEGYSVGSVEQYARPDFLSVNNFDEVDIFDKMKNSNKNNSNNNNNNNNNSNTVRVSNNNIDITSNSDGNYVDVDAIVNDVVIPVSPMNYQMGPFDQLVLTTGNPKSEYLKLMTNTLAPSKDLCVYQGHENPLKCKKTTGLNMGPTIDGVSGSPKSMFMFSNNKSSPDCCPSTFSTSTGCVCTTKAQRDFVKDRGLGTEPKPSMPKNTGSPL